MEIKDILGGKPLSQLENLEKPQIDGSLQVGKEKLESLKEIIEELKFMIKQREELSIQINEETEKIKTEITNFLLSTTATDSDGFRERSGLRHKQIEISELQLNEKVNCWRDIAVLKKELRERQKELSEKQGRIGMLDKLLE